MGSGRGDSSRDRDVTAENDVITEGDVALTSSSKRLQSNSRNRLTARV